MAKYLLECACGREHTVETRQAGESIACECGATVAVPTLRQLRQLPEAGVETAAAAGPAWGSRQQTITVSLLLTAGCLAVAGVSRMLETPLPELDKAQYAQNVDRLVENMSPLQAWERWQDTYAPLRSAGFEVFKHPAAAMMQQALTWHYWVQRIALALAAVFAVVALFAWLSKSGRQEAERGRRGDTETRRN